MRDDEGDLMATDGTPDEKPAVDQEAQKAKFREALERKKAASQHRSEGGSSATGAVHGSETTGPTQRRFQRKSGSS
jgi:hypothetical protein